MLKKKNYIQRSIRVEEHVLEDLGVLANILERSQTELINVAIEKLIQENKHWFAHNIIVDNLIGFIEGGRDEDVFDLQGMHIDVRWEEDTILLNYQLKNGDEIVDETQEKFLDVEDLKKTLRSMAQYLDLNSADVHAYLNSKLDYR